MARKIDPQGAAAPASQADVGADDVAVMFPDITLTLAGREITVREYGWEEGLRLRRHPSMPAFLADMEAMMITGASYTDDVLAVLAGHPDFALAAIAQSASVEPAWITGLRGEDAEDLQLAWWGACGPFFYRLLLRRASEKAQRRQMLSAGAASSSSSSTAASAPLNGSDAAPPASSGSTTVN